MALAARLYLWMRYRVWIRQSGGGFINPEVTWMWSTADGKAVKVASEDLIGLIKVTAKMLRLLETAGAGD